MIKTPDNILFYDTETTGLHPWPTERRKQLNCAPDRPFMFQMANLDGQTVSFRAKVNPFTREVTYKGCASSVKWLQERIENPKMTIVGHNLPFEIRMTTQSDLRWNWRARLDDTAVRWRLVKCDELTYGLKPLTKKYFDFSDDDQKALVRALTSARRAAKARGWKIATLETHGKKDSSKADYWLPELAELTRVYGESDPIRCLLLWRASEDHFIENRKNGGRVHEIYAMEQELMRTLVGVEKYGFTYRRKHGLKLRQFYADYQAKHWALIKKMGYGDLNIGSTKQMKELFIDKLKYDHLWKTDSGAPKIDSEQLMVWARGSNYGADIDGDAKDGCRLSRSVLEWKACQKVLEYLDSYEYFACRRADGSFMLHPSWKQAGTLTGRQSCGDPNLQQVASAETSRRRSTIRPRQREAFGPRPGYVWYMPDYSQVEVWIMAHLANDKNMIRNLKSGNDMHIFSARTAWGHNYDFCTCGRWKVVQKAIDKDPNYIIFWDQEKERHAKNCLIRFWRMRAKEILFSRMYGGGSKNLAGKISFLMRRPLKEGMAFIVQFDEALPGLKTFIRDTIDDVAETGVATNCFGREYLLDSRFAYKAVNYLVQGSAADVLKRAMIRIDHRLKRDWPMSHLIGTIHDETVVEVHKSEHCPRLMRAIIRDLQADSKLIPNLTVPLPVSLKITSTDWSDTRDVHFLRRAA